MSKSVCIVGAGPAGIIAAKSLLYNHPDGTFKVTVFEKSDRIGGLWPLSPTDGGMVNPEMCTNLSKHTVSFSDMAWPESSPTFPKAWHVGQYLKRYWEKYPRIAIQTACRVTKASWLAGVDSPDEKRWRVEIQRATGASLLSNEFQMATKSSPNNAEENATGAAVETVLETHHFDYLIVASGFFGKPNLPAGFKTAKESFVPIQCSTEFRRVENLLQGQNTTPNQGSNIVVVGGSMSGAEVAASIAMQLSSAVNSPGTSNIKNYDKYRVHHVIKRPFWVMPTFLPISPLVESERDNAKKVFNPAPTFLPLDLVFYNLTKRPPGPIKNNSGYIRPEEAAHLNEHLKYYVGGNQSNLVSNGSMAIAGEILTEAPWITISDSYAEFVRSGQIVAQNGRAERLNAANSSKIPSLVISSDSQESVIDDIAAIVLATGFDATSSLDFLPSEILDTLDYDPKCSPLPLSLSIHSTIHPSFPSLGFVGFYRGPFWGVMEMQSRFLGALWAQSPLATTLLPSPSTLLEGGSISDLRKAYYDVVRRQQLTQFPMGDYVYIMASFASILDIPIAGEPHSGPMLPSRYVLPNTDGDARQESMTAISSVSLALQASVDDHKFVAKAIFRGLQGAWKVQRTLTSRIATFPSGRFTGTAHFHPRYPTSNGVNAGDLPFDAEYLYTERGDFVTTTGLVFKATRQYAYRYREATDSLSAWFIKPADGKTVDYLFHELQIELGATGWKATSHHLCVADTYDPVYEFVFCGTEISRWSLGYSVRGPEKDYEIQSAFER